MDATSEPRPSARPTAAGRKTQSAASAKLDPTASATAAAAGKKSGAYPVPLPARHDDVESTKSNSGSTGQYVHEIQYSQFQRAARNNNTIEYPTGLRNCCFCGCIYKTVN